ncbi:mucin-like protein [Ruditapes philippinarum]|uniref:mucin-like protein n=1 Tax=Ruditapes philippinarum TaxID=129788 RepID=UPI00295BCE62|nr:mucin-like protein [Ruditapes philippinarum]
MVYEHITLIIHKFANIEILSFNIIYTKSLYNSVVAGDALSCQGFITDSETRDLINTAHARAESCPCIEQIIAIDDTFEKKNNCYKQWFFSDDAKQVCCYSENGQLLVDGPGAGYLRLKTRDDYIEQAHDLCCGNGSDALRESCESFYQINSPDDCSFYEPPVISISSGDPVIQTIDGGKYDFNGHGEYVFLTDGNNFEIQARTDYVLTGNIDSTYFSAFALLDKTSHEQIELHYDREADDIRLFRNGTYKSNCSASSMLGHGRPYPCELRLKHNCFVIAGGGKIIIQNCGFKSYIKQLVFGTDNFLSIQIIRDSRANITNITGLAGHREDGFYIMSNNTKVSENASALSLFQFAESWSLRNNWESVFMYKETGGNFTIYNTHHTCPEFLQDKLGNLTALFESFRPENISLFNKTCRNYWNKEPNNLCLLVIARTGDYDLGLDVMKEANATRHKWEILHNRTPLVSPNFPERITVSINSTWTINLTDYVTDDNTPPENLVFDVFTGLTKNEYSINNGIFTWNVGTGLREIDTGMQFTVYDKFNTSSVFSFSINYCGCSEVSFCLFNDSTDNPSDTVVKASCDCPGYTSGLYCEKIKDVCPNYHCYNDCNVMAYRSKPSWPCSPCPKGRTYSMHGYNQICTDIDECSVVYSGPDKCEQSCTNTDGAFMCSCFNGYELNRNGHSCDDIDECSRGIRVCGSTEICVNTLGNSSCLCAPGFQRLSDKTGTSCVKIRYRSVDDAVQVKCSDSQWDVEVDMNILQAKYPAIKPADIFLGESKCLGKSWKGLY